MGKDLANPTAMFLSAAMMLEWLGQKYQNESLMNAARLLESKIEEGFRLKEPSQRNSEALMDALNTHEIYWRSLKILATKKLN